MPSNKKVNYTIRDVAKAAGVSVATVSRVINKNIPVSQDVSERVEAVMQELNYFPKATARNLSNQKTNSIGFILDDISGDFMAPMLRGIEATTAAYDYQLLLASTNYHSNKRDYPLPLGPQNTDGILIFTNCVPEDQLRYLYEMNFPMVLIHRSSPEGMEIPHITIENKQATEEIVSHLIDVHHRSRIVLLRGPEGEEDSYWREAGYMQAMKKHGMGMIPELICAGDFNRDIAFDSICKLIEKKIPFDGIFSGDDEAAVGALMALRKHKIACPHDVSLVGFDDQNISTCLTPQLTTVKAPTEEVGRVAVEQLMNLINGRKSDPLSLLPTKLIIRESCGC
jgi:DNA-binding LacI/PurR family transcriptional regulator